MNYWQGVMDWPIDKEWECETCGENHGLEWGMIHAQCRCNQCHTQYTMRADNEKRTVLTQPSCQLKDEYKEPAKQAWAKYHSPIDQLSNHVWDEFIPVKEIRHA